MSLEHFDNPETLLGRRLEFSVQQAKSGHQGIVVSRRSILEKEQRRRAKELRKSLQPGQKIKGRVTQVREFGLFVDLGGLEGLVHLSELSWERGVKPGDVAKPGDEIEVQVLKVTEPQGRKDRDGRIALSRKALQTDPWETQTAELHEGTALKGKISRTTDFGAFVEVAAGVDGLLHITELGRDLKHANEKVKEGDEIHVVIERIDRKQRRISLSKMSAQDARLFDEGALEASTGGQVVRPGALLKVKVDRVEPAGLHVQIEGVIGRRGRGFIPNSEMGTERGTDHRKKFPQGTEIDVKVIGLDRDGGLRLSRKAFYQEEERRAVQSYRKEAATKGFGTFGDLLKKKLKS
jgi:small subunit ribosomal protein S1